ncbi:toxin [Streptomyces sp. NBC_00053]|uniref:toxin n=1 Tax=unclassified Streptomyces TaxID=2593676 RepID=UPI00225187AF|nr:MULTISPECIES: toxin [unclassified Streptomyces]MCX4395602.1 toxin [Streptomyces sp. NBC_01767]MCX5101765.1 toxin [Streptomyces sp. NBC_00439]MCX5501562.1 toxin [Streptomyces sp. NBC_00052]MCX5549903.1 toxin [Streptomyces sp. NBC_00051]WSC29196.1 toxin [Streptomyces sp. NBC_01768]
MSLRELRKECEAGLADLPIPAPFSVDALVANMEAARGRTIVLHEMPDRLARVNAACGLRLKTGGTSFVLYRRRPTAYQTQHVILHELCHEWFDHGTSLDPEQLRRLLPVFDTSLITRVLGTGSPPSPPSQSPPSPPAPSPVVATIADALRSGDGTVQARAQYDTHDERMAEFGASLIPRMAMEVTSDDMVGRLANSLSRPVANRRRGLFRRS